MTRHEIETKSIDATSEKPWWKENKEGREKDYVKDNQEAKAAKNEAKEGKDAVKAEVNEKNKYENEKTKYENEKDYKAEGKAENKEGKDEAKEKSEKSENKDDKGEFKELKDAKYEHESKHPEKQEPEYIDPFATPPSRQALLAHAEALESTARSLRHFIELSERPDLRKGALRNEPDRADED